MSRAIPQYRGAQLKHPDPAPVAGTITGRIKIGEGCFTHAADRGHPGFTLCGLSFTPPTGGRAVPTSAPLSCPGCEAAVAS